MVVVPHTGIAANVRWVPAEYGSYDGFRPVLAGSGWLEGTNEGTDSDPQGFTAPGSGWNTAQIGPWRVAARRLRELSAARASCARA